MILSLVFFFGFFFWYGFYFRPSARGEGLSE